MQRTEKVTGEGSANQRRLQHISGRWKVEGRGLMHKMHGEDLCPRICDQGAAEEVWPSISDKLHTLRVIGEV